MSAARNAIVACVIVLMLCGPLMVFSVQTVIHAELPSWLTSQDAKYLAGGVESVDVEGSLTPAGFASGDLQHAVEAEISNFIPCKALMLMGEASCERTAIEVSNLLFGWSAYPPFYGADVSYIPASNSLRANATKDTEQTREGFVRFLREISDTAQDYPDVKFAVYLVDALGISDSNPTNALVSNPATLSSLLNLAKDMPLAPNLAILCNSYEGPEEYYQNFYKTDHHWNIGGAYDAYIKIMDALELEAIEKVPREDTQEITVFGPIARSARYPVYETISSDSLEYWEGLWVLDKEGNHVQIIPDDNTSYYGVGDIVYDYYKSIYGRYIDTTIFGGNASENILLISDSFGNSLRPLFAQSAHSLTSREDMMSRKTNRVGFRQLMNQNNINEVVFVGGCSNYAAFMKRNPDYFL